MLSGCGTSGEGSTAPSTSSVAEPSNNPWDLPLEQRPALFDPCAEIPIEAVEQGLGGPVEPVNSRTHHRPGELMSCAWRTEEASISILGTWKSYDDYLADRTLNAVEPEYDIGGKLGMRMLDSRRVNDRACYQLFFSESGTVLLALDLYDLLRKFNGQRDTDACSALEQVALPITAHLPSGDFR